MSITQNSSVAREKITSFVDAYVTLKGTLDELTSFELDGAFAGDTVFRKNRQRFKNNNDQFLIHFLRSLTRLSEIGVSINKTGTFEVDDTKLDSALADSFADIATIFSGDTNNQTEVGTASRGIAGDLSKMGLTYQRLPDT